MPLTHLSLFSGIGGLDLAAEAAGCVTVGQCEWADYPTKVLEKHWPDVPRWRDIRTLTGESFYERTGLRTVDIVSGGFPCQPFSQAGKRGGQNDDRYLWPEMLRVISELKPTWVVGENVPGIINLALDTVLSDLENIGYSGQAFDIPACGVDAPHRRDRIAILAYANGKQLGRIWSQKDAESVAGQGLDNGAGAPIVAEGEPDRHKPAVLGMADGLRAAIHKTYSDTDTDRLQGRDIYSVLGSEFTSCSSRERERAGRGYDGLLRSLVEVTPLGRIGPMNPAWVEWLMGFPVGWTELSALETQ